MYRLHHSDVSSVTFRSWVFVVLANANYYNLSASSTRSACASAKGLARCPGDLSRTMVTLLSSWDYSTRGALGSTDKSHTVLCWHRMP